MGNIKKYYIVSNDDLDNYGCFYIGTNTEDGYVFLYKEISKGLSKPFLMADSDVKEISHFEYSHLKRLEADGEGFALDVTIEEIINGEISK